MVYLPLKIFGVPTAPSYPALVKIKSALRHVCITFYAGFFTMCHCIFWSFSDSAEEVWYFHADSSCVLLPGVKSCAGYVSVFLFESFCGRDRTGPVEVCISMLHVRRIYKIFGYVEKWIELFVVHCPEGADCRFWWTVCLSILTIWFL